MKINRIFAMFGLVAALCLSAHNLVAQDNGTNTGGNNNQDGGQNGARRNRGGQGGNFDPAQFQQRMMERVRDDLGFTNDTEWSAVQPLVQKVMDARRDVGFGGARMFGGRNRGGNNGDQGGNARRNPFGQSSPEADTLQKAVDDNAPAAQIKELLAKYKSAQKAKQEKLEAAQADLRKILTVKQEASATLLGLLN